MRSVRPAQRFRAHRTLRFQWRHDGKRQTSRDFYSMGRPKYRRARRAQQKPGPFRNPGWDWSGRAGEVGKSSGVYRTLHSGFGRAKDVAEMYRSAPCDSEYTRPDGARGGRQDCGFEPRCRHHLGSTFVRDFMSPLTNKGETRRAGPTARNKPNGRRAWRPRLPSGEQADLPP